MKFEFGCSERSKTGSEYQWKQNDQSEEISEKGNFKRM